MMFVFISIVFTSYLLADSIRVVASEVTCNQDLLDRSFVTQCGPGICEPLFEGSNEERSRPSDWPTSRDEVVHVVSARSGDRFKINIYPAMDTTSFYYEESHVNGTLFVDTKTKYQRILGFGTTLTDASCTNADDLPDDIRMRLIKDYFSNEDGIGLNLIKVPIGSTKFSYSNYVLDQPDNNQVELSPYDTDHRIPMIRDILKAAGKLKNRVKVLASSATAPPEYKDNHRLVQGGNIRENKISDYASYLNGYVTAYRAHALNIWSLILSESPMATAQDKGANETLDYNSMVMKPSDSVKLVKAINDIRSRYVESEKFRLLLKGDSRSYIPVWVDAVFKTPSVSNSIAGVAYTCSNDKVAPYDNLAYVTKNYPNKYLLATQGSSNSPIKLGNWQYAENYATEIVKNLEHGSVGWIDFNMALNLEGGPVISDKFKADASVMIDSKRGIFYRNPMLYAIGHLSRYIKPGSVRVKMNFYSSAYMWASQHIAFITPDNHVVAFVMNNNINPMPITIGIDTVTKVETMLATKSFNTFIFKI